jgi:hypothetical protein
VGFIRAGNLPERDFFQDFLGLGQRISGLSGIAVMGELRHE